MKKSASKSIRLKPNLYGGACAPDPKLLIKLLLDHDIDLSEKTILAELGELDVAITHARALLSCLPSTIDEVRQRTAPTSLFCLRAALFALVTQDCLKTEEADQLAPLSRVIGLGEVEGPLFLWFKLIKAERTLIWGAPRLHITRLERALALLFHSTSGQRIFERLTGEERVILSGPWVRPMMRLAQQELFPRHALLALYRSTQADDQELLIEQFERCRKRVSADPISVYSLLFGQMTVIELERLFGHLAANNELERLSSHATTFAPSVRRAYDQAVRSVSEVS